jgi:hypothetical protein
MDTPFYTVDYDFRLRAEADVREGNFGIGSGGRV